jgi:hypothetical protein
MPICKESKTMDDSTRDTIANQLAEAVAQGEWWAKREKDLRTQLTADNQPYKGKFVSVTLSQTPARVTQDFAALLEQRIQNIDGTGMLVLKAFSRPDFSKARQEAALTSLDPDIAQYRGALRDVLARMEEEIREAQALAGTTVTARVTVDKRYKEEIAAYLDGQIEPLPTQTAEEPAARQVEVGVALDFE